VTTALITAIQQAGLHHYTAPWYIAVPVVVVVLGLKARNWRRRRGSRGRPGGPGGQ
jgi:hypothetical protein